MISVKVRQALVPSGLPELDYALNPYTGCAHACVYCYAREYVRSREVANNWGRVIVAKENLPDVLRIETRRLRRGVVGLATITDPYQPVEGERELTRASLEILLPACFSVSIQTKSDLVLRDASLLEEWRGKVDVGLTITTLDSSVARVIEPGAPPPSRRARALERIASRGVETWVFLGPIIPGLTDDVETIREVVELAASTGSVLYYDKLRVKKFMREGRGLAGELASRTRGYNWGKAFARVRELCRRYRVECRPGFEYGTAEPSGNLLSYLG